MRKLFRKNSIISENRFYFIYIIISVMMLILVARLWQTQILKGHEYRNIAESNRIRKIEIPASRGIIFDRDNQKILGNRLTYDLIYIPQFVQEEETTLRIVARLLSIPFVKLHARIKNLDHQRPQFYPVVLKRNLRIEDVAIIEANRLFLPGIEIRYVPRRDYHVLTPAHLIGYLGEVSFAQLKKLNREHLENPYVFGDLIGKQGLEAMWESYLRGKRGYRYIQVDASGRETHLSHNYLFTEQPPISGARIFLTIDFDIQKTSASAFQGKNGAIVVMNPQNGAILALVSKPDYDPSIYQEQLSIDTWNRLLSQPFSPFLDKTMSGEFMPGSTYKPIVALAALEEKIITAEKKIYCPGYFRIGKKVLKCHKHKGHGFVNLKEAIKYSCDVYFYHIGAKLGVDRIAKYAKLFQLGQKLGVQLNPEKPGLVPTSRWKKETYSTSWNKGEDPLIAIGQSFTLVTPIQLASVYATIANGGKIWKPFVLSKIVDQYGQNILKQEHKLIRKIEKIKKKHMKIIQEALRATVMDFDGTGRRAKIKNHSVAGKTGSVQVVSSKKGKNQYEISMRWREHALFIAFSPVENAEIVVAVVSEHDKVGGGGRAAAPIAKKIIQAYWNKKLKKSLVLH